jgi:hypothetical protein
MHAQLLYHIFYAVICVKDNPTEMVMLHRDAKIHTKGEGGHSENLLQTQQ